jgi:hypothetical protein
VIRWSAFSSTFVTPKDIKIEASKTVETRGVSQCGLAIYIEKYVNAKEELCKLK